MFVVSYPSYFNFSNLYFSGSFIINDRFVAISEPNQVPEFSVGQSILKPKDKFEIFKIEE